MVELLVLTPTDLPSPVVRAECPFCPGELEVGEPDGLPRDVRCPECGTSWETRVRPVRVDRHRRLDTVSWTEIVA